MFSPVSAALCAASVVAHSTRFAHPRCDPCMHATSLAFFPCLQEIASIAVGYNSPRLLELASSRTFQVAASNRPALGSFPPMQYKTWLDESLMTVKPKGLDQIVTTLCGSSANENAFKVRRAPCFLSDFLLKDPAMSATCSGGFHDLQSQRTSSCWGRLGLHARRDGSVAISFSCPLARQT